MTGKPMDTPAVVVGLCSHGLTMVRALARNSVQVHALEANPDLPGFRTRHARVHLVPDINGPGLVSSLLEVRSLIGGAKRPVLFLINDNMVRESAAGAKALEGKYALSWHHARQTIRSLLHKDAIEKRCLEVGLPYPKSRILESCSQDHASAGLDYPLIVKPVRPLSRFKVKLAGNRRELSQILHDYASELPFLIQEYVPGDDRSLFFSALYLDKGKVLARFEGRKLRSYPPARGGTTAAEPFVHQQAHEAACDFFSGLELSGPVSLEFKADATGRLHVIEPTVGRTDFWVGCCIANRVNLPYLEYCHQAGHPLPSAEQVRRSLWFHTELDPLALLAWNKQARDMGLLYKGIFSYYARDDWKPWRLAAYRTCLRVWGSLKRKIMHTG